MTFAWNLAGDEPHICWLWMNWTITLEPLLLIASEWECFRRSPLQSAEELGARLESMVPALGYEGVLFGNSPIPQSWWIQQNA